MEHININSSGSVYHILHWVGECHKSCRITQSSLESPTQPGPASPQWVLFNQFVFVRAAKHQVVETRDCSGHLPHVIMSRPTISTDNGHHQGWLKELNFLKTPTVSFIRRIYIYIFYLSLKYFTSAEFWGQRTFAHFDIVGWRLCNLSSCKGIPTVLIRAMEEEMISDHPVEARCK